MRRLMWLTVISVVSCSLVVPRAWAQEGKYTIAVLAGQERNLGVPLDSDFGIGLQLGLNLSEVWAVQSDLVFSNPGMESSSTQPLDPGGNAGTTHLALNLIHFWKVEDSALVPFGGAGFSWTQHDYDSSYYPNQKGHDWGLNIAGGVRWDLGSMVFLLAEARYCIFKEPEHRSLQYLVGVGVKLGTIGGIRNSASPGAPGS